MTDEQQADAIEAAARIMAHGEPLPRPFVDLVNALAEARGGWRGNKPVDGVLDCVLDEVTDRANELRRGLIRGAVVGPQHWH
jgi:hypothetical protein